MADSPKTVNYERLTLRELKRAAMSLDDESRCAHLDQASVYATLGERDRDHSLTASGDQRSRRSWERTGTLDYAKRSALVSALEHCNYRVAPAAAMLEIGRSTMYRLMAEYCVGASAKRSAAVPEGDELLAGVIDPQPPKMRSRLEFENGKLIIVELAAQN